MSVAFGALPGALAAAQGVALAVLVARLLPGRGRLPPVPPVDDAGRAPDGPPDGKGERPPRRSPRRSPRRAPNGTPEGGAPGPVSVVVPARNEAARIGACLAGLRAQGRALGEVIVVDGGSTDGTRAVVAEAARRDPRVRLLDEPPRAPGVVGRAWAIAAGCRAARGAWVLVVDADVSPRPGMVAGALAAAERRGYDAVSFAPRIVAPTAGARALQAAFAATLVYRFGAAGVDPRAPERAVANGQCQLLRRDALMAAGGYEIAARSYCDDVVVVRRLAARGARVGFLDGRRLFDCLMYPTGGETWRAWPRSLGMRDAAGPARRAGDALFLALTMAAPVPLLAAAALGAAAAAALGRPSGVPLGAPLVAVNAALLAARALLLLPMAPSFARRGPGYWLSPLADPAAALRVAATSVQRPREWRGAAAPPPARAAGPSAQPT